MDSGSCDTVMPTSEHEDVTIVESKASRNNAEYGVANGEALPNDGERRCLIMTTGARGPNPSHSSVRTYTKLFSV